MKIFLVLLLFSPFTFSHSNIDEALESPDGIWDQSNNETDLIEWMPEEEVNDYDPFLELGGSENINYAQDHFFEEQNEMINETDDQSLLNH